MKRFISVFLICCAIVAACAKEVKKPDSTAVGPTGPQGASGASISTLEFCPGYVTTYPSTFPEYGICIDNNIYAVFYDGKNAWLAEIVPGDYISTSTSAPCSFTVKENCVVLPK